MIEPKNEQAIRKILVTLNSFSQSIDASAVMTRDGFPVVALLSDGVDADRLCAISSTMLSLAEKSIADLQIGTLKEVIIHSTESFFILVQVNKGSVLSVIAKKDTKLGMLLVEVQKAAKAISAYCED